MKYYLYLFLLTILFATKGTAQIIDGLPLDSTIIQLSGTGTHGYIADIAATPLWQIGRTHKTFFTVDTGGVIAIMTDTLNHYPVNANNSFTLKIRSSFNGIIGFWHRYQTDSAHDGGIVEFSIDNGLTWDNIKGDCNKDSSFALGASGVYSEHFYTFNDTLPDGTPAFTGAANATRFSRLQFHTGPPAKTTDWNDCLFHPDTLYVRFRFVSDAVADTLAGWMIDSVKIENDDYGEGFASNTSFPQALQPYPNPSLNGCFTFPPLNNEQKFGITIYNTLGQKILEAPYRQAINIGSFPQGLYYYTATDGNAHYSGKLLYKQ